MLSSPTLFTKITGVMLLRVTSVEFAPWSAAREAWSLTKFVYPDESRLKLFKQKVRWAVAAAIKPKRALGWFQQLQGSDLQTYVGSNRRLVFKPLRVYMSCRWGMEQKIKVLNDTYRFIRLSGVPLQNALFLAGGTRLASIGGADGCDAHLVLGCDGKYRKEGELVVSMNCAEKGEPIISMVCSLEHRPDGAWAMYVGCIQGGYGNDNKAISKVMGGLRPKAFMVFVAQEMAAALGVGRIFGIGNAIHAHKKKHIVYIPSVHGLSFDYDSLWGESDGEISANGWFEIPLSFQKRPYESIKSNKRSMYQRRYAMLDKVSEQIRSSLAGCADRPSQLH